MTRQEVVALLAYLAECYPSSPPPSDHAARIAVWHDLLGPYDIEDVMAAAQHVGRRQRWYPEPAQLIEQIGVDAHGELPSETEAWMVCTSQHVARDELHPVLIRCLELTGGVGTLSWLDEVPMMRRIRSAYWTAVEEYHGGIVRGDHRALGSGPGLPELTVFRSIDQELGDG